MNRKITENFCRGLLCLMACWLTGQVYGQTQEKRLTFSAVNEPFKVVLNLICKQAKVNRFYVREHLQKTRRVTMDVRDMPLDSVLVLLCYNQSVTAQYIDNIIHVWERRGAPGFALLVLDAAGKPLPGVSIEDTINKSIKVTDETGQVMFRPGQQEIGAKITCIGYAPMECKLRVDTAIQLRPLAKEIRPRIFYGYGRTDKKLYTGGITIITPPPAGAVNGLTGMLEMGVTGLRYQQLTGSTWGKIAREIHGTLVLGDLQGNPNIKEPLVVVNGLPFYQDFMQISLIPSIAGNPLGAGPGPDPLAGFYQGDIDSIEVLKEAVGMALFGARGSNGVIQVHTKTDTNDLFQVAAEVSIGISEAIRTPELLNATQLSVMHQLVYKKEGVDTSGAYFNRLDTLVSNDWARWMFINPALNRTANLSVAMGRKRAGRWWISGTHNNRQYPLPVKAQQTWNTVYTDFVYSPERSPWEGSTRLLYANGQTVGPLESPYNSIFLAPSIPSLYKPAGELSWSERGMAYSNPRGIMNNEYKGTIDRWLSSSRINYKISESTTATIMVGWTHQVAREIGLVKLSGQPRVTGAKSAFLAARTMQTGYTAEPQLNYRFWWGRLKIRAISGVSLQWHKNRLGKMEESGSLRDGELAAAARAARPDMDSVKNDYSFKSVFNRVSIASPGHLSADLVLRGDASTRLSQRHTWGVFWAAGLAWRFAELAIFDHSKWLSLGKLRINYGTTGSDYTGTDSVDKINWARTRMFAAGIDLQLFGRIDLKAGYYCNTGHDQYLRLPVTLPDGTVKYRLSNSSAVVRNTGWEVELFFQHRFSRQTALGLEFLATFPRNKLLEGIEQPPYNKLRKNEPLSVRMVYHFLGMDSLNRYEVKDDNRDNQITHSGDATIARNLEIRYFGNMKATLTLGRWTAFVNIERRRQPAYDPRIWLYYRLLPGNKSDDLFINQPVGFDRDPVITTKSLSARKDIGWYLNSDAMFVDGSYWLLKMAAVECRLLTRKPGSRNQIDIKLYFQGENLALITAYPRIGNPMMQPAVGLPALRSWTVGARFTFTGR